MGRAILAKKVEPEHRKMRHWIVLTSADGEKMKTQLFVTLLLLSALLLAGCTAGPPELADSSPTVVPSKPAAIQPGPGLWPSSMPAPPSPTVTPASASAVSTPPSHGAGTTGALLPIMPPTDTVATPTVAGWTTYVSINDIYDLAFAQDGTLWAVTSGGLVHWDLDTQTYIRYPIHARRLAIAPDGTLWLAWMRELYHFDGASCDTYLVDHNVLAVAVTPDRTVWVGTGQGVSRFDGDSWKSYPSPVATHDLAVTASGEVWAATAGGVGRYLPAEDEWITYTEDHGLPSSNAQVIAAGPDSEVWAYLVWQGLYRFDGTGWQKVEGAGVEIFDIAFAADGTPWVATTGGMHYPGGSLSYHDGGQWHDVTGDQALNSFTSVALGPGDIVAASTQLGLALYDGSRRQTSQEWHLLRDGPTSDKVTSVAVTPDGAAWFAFGDHSASTPGWGLSRFDGQAWDYHLDDAEVNVLAVGPDGTLWAGVGCSVQRFDDVAWEVVGHCEDLPAGNVLDIDFAPDGAVWVANGFGLARLDGQSWTAYEGLVHALEVAPDGTIWMNGWEGTQGSFYIARFDGEAWTTFKSAHSFPGGFTLHEVTPDGLLWGMTPEGSLASFDGGSWTDGESWKFYEPPGGLQDHAVPLIMAPDGALWLATVGAMARFDYEAIPDQAWTIYTQSDGLPDSYYHAMAFGPGGEIWFGATRYQPAKAETNTEGSMAAPQIVETAGPIAATKPRGMPAPYCRPSEAFVDLSAPSTVLEAGEFLTVTVTLANGDGSDARLGQIQWSLSMQPETLVLGSSEPVQHSTIIEPGGCDQAQFVLRGVAPGRLVITASASYEMHALDYSWGSWSGCQSPSLEITIVP
jgi:ligand-binding sensor domain-containing protein